jgi:IgA Peptidase M64
VSHLRARTVLFAIYLAASVSVFTHTVQAEPVTTIRNNGDSSNRVDIAILGDGYTFGDLPKYAADIETFVQGFFAQEPYKEYQRFFNVHRIDVFSNESGADHPERNPPVLRDTAFDATYNCAAIQRLVCVNVSKVNEILFRSVPAEKRDIVLVIVNDPEYGASGGAVAVASVHSEVVELILHELGHTLGLLADEYGSPPPPFCDSSIEPPEVNATRASVRSQIKWNLWINPATVIPTLDSQAGIPGLYPGAKYCDVGLFRPTFNSKMRSLNMPFEQINSEQLIKRIYNWVSPIDSIEPWSSVVTLTKGSSQIFRVNVPQPLTHSLEITWTLDGQPIGSGAEVIVTSSGLGVGDHAIHVVVSDPTSSVQSDPIGLLSDSETWTLRVVDGSIAKLGNISTRGSVLTGDNVMIGGFIIDGSSNKRVLVRSRGPSMGGAPFNVAGTLANPVMQLFSGSTVIAQNDNWQDVPSCTGFTCGGATEIAATALDPCQPNPGQSASPPSCNLESAILITLPPGAYTAIVRGANGGTGVGLVEVFEADTSTTSTLANISTRGSVQTGDNVMIGGLIVAGSVPKTVLIRARGPSMGAAPFNVPGTLPNPFLRLFSGSTVIAQNDNWQDAPSCGGFLCAGATQITATGLDPCQPNPGQSTAPPGCAQEAAILITLPPGAYTAIVSGIGGGTGVGLVEVFDAD